MSVHIPWKFCVNLNVFHGDIKEKKMQVVVFSECSVVVALVVVVVVWLGSVVVRASDL